MSLRQQVQQAVQAGISAVGDMAERAIYTSVPTTNYEPSSGTITAPPMNYLNVPVVFGSFSRMEIDGNAVRAEDQKATIATLDLTPVPTINDRITDEGGIVWNVIGVLSGPGRVVWVLHVRRP